MSEYVWKTKVSRKKAYEQKQSERDAQAKDEETFLQALNTGIDAQPCNIVDGQCEERFPVPASCTGIIIGKKGENLKSIQERFKVTVKIEGIDRKQESKQDVTPEVVIRGQYQRDVDSAAKALDFVAEDVEVPRDMAGWVCGKGNRHLKLFKELTGVVVLSMRRDGESNNSHPGAGTEIEENMLQSSSRDVQDSRNESVARTDPCWIEVRGLRSHVADALMCLETHMQYYPVFSEMKKVEEDLDLQLAEANAQLGRRQGPAPESNGAKSNGTSNNSNGRSREAVGAGSAPRRGGPADSKRGGPPARRSGG